MIQVTDQLLETFFTAVVMIWITALYYTSYQFLQPYLNTQLSVALMLQPASLWRL